MSINITVVDVNDNEPQFTSLPYEASVTEDAVIGTTVLTLRAVDADLGLNAQLDYLLGCVFQYPGSLTCTWLCKSGTRVFYMYPDLL